MDRSRRNNFIWGKHLSSQGPEDPFVADAKSTEEDCLDPQGRISCSVIQNYTRFCSCYRISNVLLYPLLHTATWAHWITELVTHDAPERSHMTSQSLTELLDASRIDTNDFIAKIFTFNVPGNFAAWLGSENGLSERLRAKVMTRKLVAERNCRPYNCKIPAIYLPKLYYWLVVYVLFMSDRVT